MWEKTPSPWRSRLLRLLFRSRPQTGPRPPLRARQGPLCPEWPFPFLTQPMPRPLALTPHLQLPSTKHALAHCSVEQADEDARVHPAIKVPSSSTGLFCLSATPLTSQAPPKPRARPLPSNFHSWRAHHAHHLRRVHWMAAEIGGTVALALDVDGWEPMSGPCESTSHPDAGPGAEGMACGSCLPAEVLWGL